MLDLGCDLLVVDQPIRRLGRAIGGVGGKAIGVEILPILNPLDYVRAAFSSAAARRWTLRQRR